MGRAKRFLNIRPKTIGNIHHNCDWKWSITASDRSRCSFFELSDFWAQMVVNYLGIMNVCTSTQFPTYLNYTYSHTSLATYDQTPTRNETPLGLMPVLWEKNHPSSLAFGCLFYEEKIGKALWPYSGKTLSLSL